MNQETRNPAAAAATRLDDAKSVAAAAPPEHKKAGIGDRLLFALSRLVGIKTTLEEARTRTYPMTIPVPDHTVDPDQAEFLFKGQREDSTHTDDKVKQLLTLSSSLATVVLVFARDVRPPWMVVVLLGLLVSAVFLCLSVLDVRTFQIPTLEDATNKDLKSVWARDLLQSFVANKARHDFRVDRYRAAGRYFRAALILTPVAAAFTVARPDPADKLKTSLDRIEQAIARTRDQIDTLTQRGLLVRPVSGLVPVPAPRPARDQAITGVRPKPDSADAGRLPKTARRPPKE